MKELLSNLPEDIKHLMYYKENDHWMMTFNGSKKPKFYTTEELEKEFSVK